MPSIQYLECKTLVKSAAWPTVAAYTIFSIDYVKSQMIYSKFDAYTASQPGLENPHLK